MCVDVCNFDALHMSTNIFISGVRIDDLRVSPQQYSITADKMEEYRKKLEEEAAPKVKGLEW